MKAKAKPVQRRVQRELRARPPDRDAVRRDYAELFSLTRSALSDLRGLEPSEGDTAEFREIIEAQERVVTQVEAGVDDFVAIFDEQARAQAHAAEITRARRLAEVERLGAQYPSPARLARDMRAAGAASVTELPSERVGRAYLQAQLKATESLRISQRIERRQRANEAESRRLERRLSEFGVEGCDAAA